MRVRGWIFRENLVEVGVLEDPNCRCGLAPLPLLQVFMKLIAHRVLDANTLRNADVENQGYVMMP